MTFCHYPHPSTERDVNDYYTMPEHLRAALTPPTPEQLTVERAKLLRDLSRDLLVAIIQSKEPGHVATQHDVDTSIRLAAKLIKETALHSFVTSGTMP